MENRLFDENTWVQNSYGCGSFQIAEKPVGSLSMQFRTLTTEQQSISLPTSLAAMYIKLPLINVSHSPRLLHRYISSRAMQYFSSTKSITILVLSYFQQESVSDVKKLERIKWAAYISIRSRETKLKKINYFELKKYQIMNK